MNYVTKAIWKTFVLKPGSSWLLGPAGLCNISRSSISIFLGIPMIMSWDTPGTSQTQVRGLESQSGGNTTEVGLQPWERRPRSIMCHWMNSCHHFPSTNTELTATEPCFWKGSLYQLSWSLEANSAQFSPMGVKSRHRVNL